MQLTLHYPILRYAQWPHFIMFLLIYIWVIMPNRSNLNWFSTKKFVPANHCYGHNFHIWAPIALYSLQSWFRTLQLFSWGHFLIQISLSNVTIKLLFLQYVLSNIVVVHLSITVISLLSELGSRQFLISCNVGSIVL